MSEKVKRIAIISSIAVFVILAVLLFSMYIFFKLAVPDYNGMLKISGLKGEVEVRTDNRGIPHIVAGNDWDLFFAQGYITARERMFQMDTTRLAGRGELSMLFGETTVKTDRYFKTLGFFRAAEEEYKHLTPETKTAVDAYTAGVNEYIRTVKRLPREYVILGAKPREWKPADCVVGALLMSYRLNAPRAIKPLLTMIDSHRGRDMLNRLLPWVPAGAPMISGTGGAGAQAVAGTAIPAPSVTDRSPVVTVADLYCPVPLRMRASNWMIFAGSRTTTGKPVFTGSPDLEAVIPSLFYLVHLKNATYDVIGGSIAGLPGVHALGFNGKYAWSITVGNGDNTDFFVEKLDPADPDQYLTETGYRKFTIIEETIKIKSGSTFKKETIRVKISRHGPVISGIMNGMPQNCTLLWPGLMGRDGTLDGLLTANRGRSFNDFRRSLGMVRGASVHVGYADVDGNIGYQYMTTFPVRKSGDNPVPVPGETGTRDWAGFLPFEQHPFALNPAKGYLGSFNQMPAPGNFYGTAFFLFERPFRFEEMANAKKKFTVREIAAMQNDTGSHAAKRFIPYISRACSRNSSLKEHVAMLEKWDRFISIDSSEATIFNAFLTQLVENTFADDLGREIVNEMYKDLHVSIPVQWLIRYLDDPENPFWDNTGTPAIEKRDDMIEKSMGDAIAGLKDKFGSDTNDWDWGGVHRMTIRHPLGTVLPFLNLGPYTYAGDDFTIHAGWWNRENPFEMTSGAAIRIVVDMSDLSTMSLMSPPGQSGHFTSPHYGDLAEAWSRGEQVPAHYTSYGKLKNVLKLVPRK